MKKINPAYTEALLTLTNACPYFRLVSMDLKILDVGRSLLELEVEQKHLQPFGIAHGGVFSSLVDAAAFWAVFGELDEGMGATTLEMKLNFLAPVQSGRIIARGRRIRIGKTIALGEATVQDKNGKTLAYGTATLMLIRGFLSEGMKSLPSKFLS
jgi:uncharacterized protein (TIGR00369 family)